MSDKEKKIVETFELALPHLSDRDKDRMLAFAEGMAFKVAQEQGKKKPKANKGKPKS